MTHLQWLQQWYEARCDGLWEHGYGIEIGTLDNPGWTVKVDLQGTPYIDKPFLDVKRAGVSDWIDCRKRDGCFEGAGGATNLEELLGVFRGWIESQNESTSA